MVNWKNVKRLRDHIAVLKPKQVNMAKLIFINKKEETLAQAARPECGTVGCLAGHGFTLFGPRKLKLKVRNSFFEPLRNCSIDHFAPERFDPIMVTGDALELSHHERDHMFYAKWVPTKNWIEGTITKREVLRYLDKAIKAKDILVEI
jgi:hypothetical protein